jgi:hypothetical protein
MRTTTRSIIFLSALLGSTPGACDDPIDGDEAAADVVSHPPLTWPEDDAPASAEREGEDWAQSEDDDSEPVDWSPGTEVTDVNRPTASGLYCGFVCPPPLVQTGIGCSTGCTQWGACPNAVFCQALPPPPPKAAIWGSPETVVVAPQTLGVSKICWDTQGLNYPVWIRVRVDNGPGKLFTKESDSGKDCENASWIQAGKTYKFRIHDDDADNSPVYATGTVVGVAGGGGGGGGKCGSCPSGQDCHCHDVCRPSNMICP